MDFRSSSFNEPVYRGNQIRVQQCHLLHSVEIEHIQFVVTANIMPIFYQNMPHVHLCIWPKCPVNQIQMFVKWSKYIYIQIISDTIYVLGTFFGNFKNEFYYDSFWSIINQVQSITGSESLFTIVFQSLKFRLFDFSRSENDHSKSRKLPSYWATLMLVTDVVNEMYWWQF